MTNILINDTTGTWSLNFLTSGYFGNPSLLSASTSRISVAGSSGATMTLTGNFSSSSYYYWTVSSLSVSQYGTTRLTISDIDMYYYQLDSLSTASLLAGSDTINSNIAIGSNWYTYGGNDIIKVGTGNDTVDGGSGTDRLVIDDSFSNARFSSLNGYLQLKSADGLDQAANIELLQFQDRTVAVQTGSYYANTLTGDTQSASASDVLLGGNGNDTLRGLTGNDVLYGESGNDRLEGGSGRDAAFGGGGNDLLDMGGGGDLARGGNGSDTLSGGKSGDRLFGDGGADVLNGGSGSDLLNGGGGNDRLTGHAGSDTLNGGDGRDHLLGHRGNDLLAGGAGNDVFQFHKGHGNDTITDFELGADLISIGRGAADLGDLDFSQNGADVLVAFADVTILVEDISASELRDAGNFLF